MRLLAFALLAVSTTALAQPPAAADKPAAPASPDYEAMKKRWEADRQRLVAGYTRVAEADLETAEKNLADKKAALKKAFKKADVAKLKAEVSTADAKVQQAKDQLESAAHKAPSLSFADLKEGSFGKLDDTQFKIVQVIDGSNAIMKVGPRFLWVETDTKGMVDDTYANIFKYAHCLGTKTYATPSGASFTVKHLRFVE